jgi:hypothetical protein
MAAMAEVEASDVHACINQGSQAILGPAAGSHRADHFGLAERFDWVVQQGQAG